MVLATHPQVRAVFRMGSIGQPGVSDLDIITVVADRGRISDLPDVRGVHPEAPYILMHSPFLIAETMFSEVHHLAGVSRLERLAGSIAIPNPERVPPLVRLQLAAKYALDALYFCCRAVTMGTLRVRAALCTLNTSTYLLDLIRDSATVPSEAMEVAAQIQDLRSSWFDRPDVQRLWALVSGAVTAYIQILDAIGDASPLGSGYHPQGISWMNMRVVASGGAASAVTVQRASVSRLLDRLPFYNLHVDDLRWSLHTCRVEVTPAVEGILSPAPADETTRVLIDRADRVTRYAEWFRTAPPYFSMLAPQTDTPGAATLKWRALAGARRLLTR